jgi:Mlc titration factor MtfA (ptsG expression regulator)
VSWWRWIVAWLRARFVRFARRQLIGEHAVVDEVKRAKLRTQPLSDAHRLLLDTWFPPFGRLSKAQRAKFVADLQVVLGEKPIDADGVELDDRIRLIVAASAALMVAGLDIAVFDHVTRIVVRKEPFEDRGPDLVGRYMQADHPVAGKFGEVQLMLDAVIEAVERAELFATSSEMFFEIPRRLAKVAPSLFDELRVIYNVDPRTFTTK